MKAWRLTTDRVKKVHHLKLSKKHYSSVLFGHKTFEIRKNDRDYMIDDYVYFDEVYQREYTGQHSHCFRITFIVYQFEFKEGLKNNYCVFGIEMVNELETLFKEYVHERN